MDEGTVMGIDEREAMLEAVETALEREEMDRIELPEGAENIPAYDPIRLPRKAAEIPDDCFVDPRHMKRWGRTEDFLNALDAKIRQSPAEGVPVKEACELMRQFGGNLKVNSLYVLLERTRLLHSLTVYKNHVRLSTKELLERLASDRVA